MSPSVEFTSQNTKCPRNSRKTKLKDGSHCLKMDALKDPPHAFYSTGESYLRGVCSHEHMVSQDVGDSLLARPHTDGRSCWDISTSQPQTWMLTPRMEF
ncbi:hypothetical protein NQZ68_040012 [Dissostichus eleginoides]|nr:hypothetical protein NQZ68_040012 [Dissostichus eleginoides]